MLVQRPDLLSNQHTGTNKRKSASANHGFEHSNRYSKFPDPEFNCVTINDLNDDCLIQIFLHLPIADRIRLERVCTRWQTASLESWKVVASLDLKHSKWNIPLSNNHNTNMTTVNHESLRKVLTRSGRFLKELDLMQWPQPLSTETLKTISELCPDIQSLNLYNMNISSSGIVLLKNKCRNLTKFQFTPSYDSFESDLSDFFNANKKLKIFHIDEHFSTKRISGRCIQSLPFDTIEEIRMFDTYGLNSRYVEKILTKCKNLRILAMNGILDLPESTIEVIGKVRTITNLELKDEEAEVSPSVMICLANLVNLERLCLDRNPSVTDELLIQISINCKRIKVLSVSECDMVTHIGVSSLVMLPKLEKLDICGVSKITVQVIYDLSMLRLFMSGRGHQANKRESSHLLRAAAHVVDYSTGDRSMNNHMIIGTNRIMKRQTNITTLSIHVDLAGMEIPEELKALPFLQILDRE